MLRGTSGFGFDDASDAADDVHDVVVVSASQTGEKSLVDVTLLAEVMGVSGSKQQAHSNNQQQAVQ